MEPSTKLGVTLGLLALLVGVGAADYYFADGLFTADLIPSEEQTNVPEGAAVKYQGPNVAEAAQAVELDTRGSTDTTILSQVIQGESGLETLNVLSEGDRAGSVSWIQTNSAKTTYATLKDALLSAFSSEVSGLDDRTVADGTGPVYNMLSFTDPALSEEKLIFVRIRERVYEFHVAEGQEGPMQRLVAELVK